jgi:hypothetical protein
LGLIFKKADELVSVIEEEDSNRKKSSEVCRDVQKDLACYSVIYEEDSYTST